MSVKHILKQAVLDKFENYKIQMSKSSEIKKFEDSRRKKIYEKCKLSNSQMRAIDNLYEGNYGMKIPYIWHMYYMSFTENFDVNYFPELLFIPEFERFMNLGIYKDVFADKNVLPMIAKNGDVRTPVQYLSKTSGILRNGDYCSISENDAIKLLYNIGEAFAKPTIDSCSGQGCRLLHFKYGKNIYDGKTVQQILKELGNNYVIQERVKCHSSISRIYNGSVNTFRVITYRWKDSIKIMPVIMRIGQGGSYLDNAHAGGMFIAVNNDGTLHSTAFSEFQDKYERHPETNILFKSYKIECFDKVIKAAYRMQELIPQVGCVNWDFTIDEFGNAILIEGNMRGGSIWLPQIAHGRGPFGENTKEILCWLNVMKNMKPSERELHKFGF